MNAIEILRAASRSVPNEDYVHFCAAVDAVAEVVKCGDVAIKAFEALGRSNGVIDTLESRRECERSLVEQKAALANVGGAA